METIRRYVRKSKTALVVFLGLVVLAGIVMSPLGGAIRGPISSAMSSVKHPVTSVSTGGPGAPGGTSTVQPLLVLDDATMTKIHTVVTVWSSYPNQAGRAATLRQLAPFVTATALQDVASSWTGPELGTLVVTASQIHLVVPPISPSATTILVQATADQAATHPDGSITDATFGGGVVLQRQPGGSWSISHLYER